MGDHANSNAALWNSVRAIMVLHYGEENINRFAKDTKLGLATVGRIKEQQTSVGLAVMDKIASKFNYSSWQLLVPGFDPKNPPTLQPVSERERALYERIMTAAKDFAGEAEPPPFK